MVDICKEFPGVKALDNAQFELRSGEVHVLLGENGAGKSTLMKILSGVYKKDTGKIFLDGKETEINGVREAQTLGISIIHQEISLLPDRTIAQNIFLGREPVKKVFKNIDKKKMEEDSQKLLNELKIDLSSTDMVRDLSIAKQQMVEVVKALSFKTRILIMDEPTSSLTEKEIDSLFEIIAKLKAQGVGIIYISHRMEEIFEIGDRVTVMRDGKYVGTKNVTETSMDELVSMMIGHNVTNMYSRTYNNPGEVVLHTENLTGLRFRNVSVDVRRGEIVGMAGLVGAGRTEFADALFGKDPILGGKIFLNGKEMGKHTPVDSVKNGIAYLPEDRKNEGLVLQADVAENIVQASYRKLFPNHLIKNDVQDTTARKYVKELRIATPSIHKMVGSLSGGNQQKVVLGKWLSTGNQFFIFDEPTRGIDVGAKHEIYELMNTLAAEGAAILFISSDQRELIGISDRIYVMCDGEVTGEMSHDEVSVEKILKLALGKEVS